MRWEKHLPGWVSIFTCQAKPEFHLHLASWRVIIQIHVITQNDLLVVTQITDIRQTLAKKNLGHCSYLVSACDKNFHCSLLWRCNNK
jgi:hypothetical protein